MEAFSCSLLLFLQVHRAGDRGGSSCYSGFIISYSYLQFVSFLKTKLTFTKLLMQGKTQIVYFMHKM